MQSLKNSVQRLLPQFLLHYYKKKSAYRILKQYDIEEQPEIKWCRKLLDGSGDMLDIGANIGMYTCYLAEHAGRVISIEPIPWTFDILKYNIRKFGLTNVTTVNDGISNSAGTGSFEVPTSESGIKNYYRARMNASASDGIEVQLDTIDGLTARLDLRNIKLIKIDVEGHEWEVIQGAAHTLANDNPALLIEVDGDPDVEESNAGQLFHYLHDFGYEAYTVEEGALKKRQKGEQAVNYFFLAEEHRELLQIGKPGKG